MNGRCDNNALDAAFDVCDACGGEYCQSCLLFPNGMKKVPLCKTCAIANSGVRNRAKRARVQSRGSANKRRKELRKIAAEEQSKKIVRIEELPDYEFGPATEVVEDKPKKKRLRRKQDPAAAAAEAGAGAEAEAEETIEWAESDDLARELEPALEVSSPESASKRLDEFRVSGEVGTVTSDEADLWNFPTNFDAQPAPALEPEPVEPDQQTNPTWEPLHNPDASNPFDDPSAGRLSEASMPQETTAFPAPDANLGPMHEPADRRGRPTQVPPPEHRNAERIPIELLPDAPVQQYPPAPTASDAATGPAPLVQPEPEPDRKKKKRSLMPSRSKEPAAVVVPDEAVKARVQDATTDTDAAGEWIPPNLRGMIAQESQTELPKRRRSTD